MSAIFKKWKTGTVRHPLLWILPALVSCIALISAVGENHLSGIDTDGDQLSDSYELFYGLCPTNASDAILDYDSDGLSNLTESKKLTDPFSQDTDVDGFTDDVDDSISRAYIKFGNARFTSGDDYEYAHPDWLTGVSKRGGNWVANVPAYETAWHLNAAEPANTGSILVGVDSKQLSAYTSLVYAIHFLDHSNSSLSVDLMTANGKMLAQDVCGNICKGTGEDTIQQLVLPIGLYPKTSVIQLRGCGEVTVYEALIYVDQDLDNLDVEQESQLHTSDRNADSNHNGINDWDEVFVCHADPSAPPTDSKSTNTVSQTTYKLPKSKWVFVDKAKGDRRFSGRRADVSGTEGPKPTIRDGLSTVEPGDTLVIKRGVYNEHLDIRGKDVKVTIEGNVKL